MGVYVKNVMAFSQIGDVTKLAHFDLQNAFHKI